jgi:hypothetical protein
MKGLMILSPKEGPPATIPRPVAEAADGKAKDRDDASLPLVILAGQGVSRLPRPQVAAAAENRRAILRYRTRAI